MREELEQKQTVSDICIWNKKWEMKKMINPYIFYNIRQWSVRLICPLFLIIWNNVSHPLSGRSAHTYIHILQAIFRLVRTSLALTDTQQSVVACNTSKNIKEEKWVNEWVSERKNKHINENVYVFVCVYIYIARAGASKLIGMSKNGTRWGLISLFPFPRDEKKCR
jgi:hypothetical protein